MSSALNVLIVESGSSSDFYFDRLDGTTIRQLFRVLFIKSEFHFALDLKHLKKAIKKAKDGNYDVVHVSCHGLAKSKGIGLADDSELSWPAFAKLFADIKYSPKALVMSACWGAADAVAEAFTENGTHPGIIIGTTEDCYYSEYAVAWSILYSKFKSDRVTKTAAQQAVKSICAVVQESFRYLRWAGNKKTYMRYPPAGKAYEVVEVKAAATAKPPRSHK
jgi:CHAT domain